MKPFFAIVKLTVKSAVRSYVFLILLLVLIACVIVVPNTILGDGTAMGFIQISLQYSIGIVGFILSLSTIWQSCSEITQDMEFYQLHMIVAKPVSRATVWLGKCTGVILINGFLLLIATSIIYVSILWQFGKRTFSKGEKEKIRNEVMVGRRVYTPIMPDITPWVINEYKARLRRAREMGIDPIKITSKRRKVMKNIRKEIMATLGEIKPGIKNTRFWFYKGLPVGVSTPVYLRYKPYIGSVSTNNQRESSGLWSALASIKRVSNEKQKGKRVNNGKSRKGEEVVNVFVPLTPTPEKFMCGVFNEIPLSPKIIRPDGSVTLAFTNFDRKRKSIFIQVPGPKLLIKKTTFLSNYLRGVAILFLRIVFLAGLSCAFASFLTLPTAIFITMSYLLIGTMADSLLSSYKRLMDIGVDFDTNFDLLDKFGTYISKLLLLLIIPIQKFDISDMLSCGYLVEYSFIAKLFFQFFVLRGLPFILLGMLVYKNRELGLVIKK